jgi:hypothetical protein
MLNVYKKFDKPKELAGYKETRPVIIAIDKLLKSPKRIKPEEKELLLSNAHLKIFANDAKLALLFATYILEKRYPAGEDMIAKDPYDAFAYAKDVLKGSWKDIGKPEVEQFFMRAPAAYRYARDVIKGRWSEAEPYIMKDTYFALQYAKDIIKGRWPEAEPAIQQGIPYWREYCKLFSIGGEENNVRLLAALQKLSNNPGMLTPTDKKLLLKNSHLEVFNTKVHLATNYALYIAEKRLPEKEDFIATDSHTACKYAAQILKCRWKDIGKPEVEQTIMLSPYWAYMYAKDVIKRRWKEAEPAIKNGDFSWTEYRRYFHVTQ